MRMMPSSIRVPSVVPLALLLLIAGAAPACSSPPADNAPREESQHPDPQSAEFLELIVPSDIPPVDAQSGQSLLLIDELSVAEYPDYDPLSDIDKISLHWEQTEGPAATLTDPDSVRARATLPQVEGETRLAFKITVKNKSGSRSGLLVVLVH